MSIQTMHTALFSIREPLAAVMPPEWPMLLDTLPQGDASIAGYTNSRNLSDALNDTLNYWSYRGTSPYHIGFKLCQAVMQNQSAVKFEPYFRTINTEEAANLTVDSFIEPLRLRCPTNQTSIHFCYISKGKTFAKNLLDGLNLDRCTNIETLLIQNISHFIRVYRNFPGTNPNDVFIVSDLATPEIIDTIFVLLPLILNIKPLEITDNFTDTEKEFIEKQNARINLVMEYFNVLAAFWQSNNIFTFIDNNGDPTALVRETIQTIKRIITAFTDSYNLKALALNTFIDTLANVKNNKMISSTSNELSRLESNIRSCEHDLEEYYGKRSQLQRLIAAQKAVSAEDVQPFMDAINASKNIEILEISKNELRLRVTAPLQYFNPDDFTHYERRPDSDFMRKYTSPEARSVFHKIFVTREYSLVLQAIIQLNVSTYNSNVLAVNAVSRTNIKDSEFTECPNPHLWHHNCWSEARSQIDKNIADGNYDLIASQIIAAVQSVNVAEAPSFISGLLNDLQNPDITRLTHVIDNSTKEVLTWSGIYSRERTLLAEERQKKAEEAKQAAIDSLQNKTTEGYSQVVISENDELTELERSILANAHLAREDKEDDDDDVDFDNDDDWEMEVDDETDNDDSDD